MTLGRPLMFEQIEEILAEYEAEISSYKKQASMTEYMRLEAQGNLLVELRERFAKICFHD